MKSLSHIPDMIVWPFTAPLLVRLGSEKPKLLKMGMN
jgi:hypothetical protein